METVYELIQNLLPGTETVSNNVLRSLEENINRLAYNLVISLVHYLHTQESSLRQRLQLTSTPHMSPWG